MADTGHDAGIEPRALYALADAIFTYIDQVCSVTVEGYAYEQSMAAVQRVDARRRLVELAVRSPPASEPELAGAAADAGWRLPARVAVVAFRDERVARVASRLGPDALVARVDGTGWAIVGDPDGPGRHATLQQGLKGVRAGVGPAVAATAAVEFRAAGRAGPGAMVGAPGPVWAENRRVDLPLAGDPVVAHGLVEDVLGPLATAPEAARERLVETLAAWLSTRARCGRPPSTHVHYPERCATASRSCANSSAHVGSAEGRLELELAPRAGRLVRPGPPSALRPVLLSPRWRAQRERPHSRSRAARRVVAVCGQWKIVRPFGEQVAGARRDSRSSTG